MCALASEVLSPGLSRGTLWFWQSTMKVPSLPVNILDAVLSLLCLFLTWSEKLPIATMGHRHSVQRRGWEQEAKAAGLRPTDPRCFGSPESYFFPYFLNSLCCPKHFMANSKDFMYRCQPVRLEPVPALNCCVPHLASILKTSHL